jgi:hypothetical protein
MTTPLLLDQSRPGYYHGMTRPMATQSDMVDAVGPLPQQPCPKNLQFQISTNVTAVVVSLVSDT